MFIPTIDTYMTIDLPGEKTRAVVMKILNDNKVVVQLISVPLAKSHMYQKDDYVACVRKNDMLGDTWKAQEARPTLEEFMEKIDVERTNIRANGKSSKK